MISLWIGFSCQPLRISSVGEVVEQLGVGRRRSPRSAEVAGRGDEAAADVVLPQPVDDHAGQQVPGAVFDVGEPVRPAPCAGTRVCEPAGGGRDPALVLRRASDQHLQEAERRPSRPSGRVAAAEEVRLREEVRALRVQADGGQAFAARPATLPAFGFGCLRRHGLRRGRSSFAHVGVDGAIPLEERLASARGVRFAVAIAGDPAAIAAGRHGRQSSFGSSAVAIESRGRPMPWPVLLLNCSVTVSVVPPVERQRRLEFERRPRGPCRTAGRPPRRTCRSASIAAATRQALLLERRARDSSSFTLDRLAVRALTAHVTLRSLRAKLPLSARPGPPLTQRRVRQRFEAERA